MKTLLANLKDNKELCAIFNSYEDPDRFSVGYIEYVDGQSYLMQAVCPYGKNDGWKYGLLEDIASVEIDTDYLKDIGYLIKYHYTQFDNIKLAGKNILIELLNAIFVNQYVCSYCLVDGERSVCGKLCKIDTDADLLAINQADLSGNYSGVTYVKINDIIKIVCQSQDEVKIDILSKLKEKA